MAYGNSDVVLWCQLDGGSLHRIEFRSELVRGRSLVHPRADANELSSRVAELQRVRRVHSWLPLIGYEVTVHNHAENVANPHAAHDSENTPCAKVVDEASGKLEVAPCFLAPFLAGPYWALDYDEFAGYALISAGAPAHETAGGCSTGNAGFWIFTRQQTRNETL